MEKVEIINFSNILITALGLGLLYVIILFKRKKYEDPFLRKVILHAFTFKIIGTVLYFLYYFYMFKGGDTFEYFNAILEFKTSFYKYPLDTFASLFQNPENYSQPIQKLITNHYYYTPEESLTIKFGALFGILFNGSYMMIAFFYSAFAFGGIWRLFKTITYIFPDYKKQLAFFILFFPTIVFWSSAITKDALVMGALGYFIYSFYKLFIVRKFSLLQIIMLLGSLYLIGGIKAYILVALLPALLLWLLLYYKSLIKNVFLRKLSIPLFAGVLLILFYEGLNLMDTSDSFKAFTMEEISDNIVTYNNYLSQPGFAGSAYNIGVIEPNLKSIATIFPAAINVTLFRPFFWESNNIAGYMTSLESLFTLLFTLYVLLKTGLFKSFSTILKSPFLLFCLIFTLVFAGAVGMTSGNFGTLARYKIPCLPFYFTMLVVLWQTGIAKKRT